MQLHFYNEQGEPVFPFETAHQLPAFDKIHTLDVVDIITTAIEGCKNDIEALLNSNTVYTWDNLMVPLDELGDYIHRLCSPINHMNSCLDDSEIRNANTLTRAALTEYASWIGQNTALYEAIRSVGNGDLTPEQRRMHDDEMIGFRLSGCDLTDTDQLHLADVNMCLASLSNEFTNNITDATASFTKLVESAEELDGLPELALKAAKAAAEQAGLTGYLFTLDYPSVFPVLEHCSNRALREELSYAMVTRASEIGPDQGKFDNTDIIKDILQLKHEKAQILGFDNYAELSLVRKSAASPDVVFDFIADMVRKSEKQSKVEADELITYAQTELGLDQLLPHDRAFASTALKEAKYAFSQDDVRPYFPESRVLAGLFTIINCLYDIEIFKVSEIDGEPVQLVHPDTSYYQVFRDGKVIASFYFDLHARTGKQGGAWMDNAFDPIMNQQGEFHTPVAYLTCNFTPPSADHESLLTHDEVTTLFHEFGHGLHHMLTRVHNGSHGGINGVPWDAVELPSQFMENWCWEVECLELISGHYQTGEPLPVKLMDQMINAKNYASALGLARQIELSLFDMRIHHEYTDDMDMYDVLRSVREMTSHFIQAEYNRFPCQFGHIFGGGYAAGYYSYKFAEVLSADAFSKFEVNGIFDKATAKDFEDRILAVGGSADILDQLTLFLGREPSVDALLRHTGIITD